MILFGPSGSGKTTILRSIAGLVQPLAMITLFDVFPAEERGRGMAVYGLGVIDSPALGPAIGPLDPVEPLAGDDDGAKPCDRALNGRDDFGRGIFDRHQKPDNAHAQCVSCNQHKAGNVVAYRQGLLLRIGASRLDALENNNETQKWTREGLRVTRAVYRRALREMEKQHGE